MEKLPRPYEVAARAVRRAKIDMWWMADLKSLTHREAFGLITAQWGR
jgi:hypothetical protein